jgi:Abortive infection alpha
VTLAVDDEDRKDASVTITSEALKVLPEADKQIAGRSLGGTLANLTAAAEDVSQWFRVIASVPREALGFVGRVFDRWRRMPPHRRSLPAPKLLLEAAAGYGAATEEDLKVRYERLLSSAIDSEAAPRVHPAFAEMIGQMTGAEARLLDFFDLGGYFASNDAFISALGFALDKHQLAVAMQNLERLGLVTSGSPVLVEPASANTPDLKRAVAQRLGEIHVEEVTEVALVDADGTSTGARMKQTSRHGLTALGQDFLSVVGRPGNPLDDQ